MAGVRVEIQQMVRWHLSVTMPVATAFSGTPATVAQGASSVVDLSTFWPVHQKLWCGKETNGTQKIHNNGLFSTSAGSAELPPKAECPGFVLGIFYIS